MRKRQKVLFSETRDCAICDAKAPNNVTVDKRNGVRVIALQVYLYWPGMPKRRPVASKRLRICDTCLVKAAAGPSSESRKIGALLAAAAADRYSGHLEREP